MRLSCVLSLTCSLLAVDLGAEVQMNNKVAANEGYNTVKDSRRTAIDVSSPFSVSADGKIGIDAKAMNDRNALNKRLLKKSKRRVINEMNGGFEMENASMLE